MAERSFSPSICFWRPGGAAASDASDSCAWGSFCGPGEAAVRDACNSAWYPLRLLPPRYSREGWARFTLTMFAGVMGAEPSSSWQRSAFSASSTLALSFSSDSSRMSNSPWPI
eukprot:1781532-Heterocapsa_arctica.AAC.1